MSNERSFDTALREWLENGPTAISDWALQSALDEVHATPQRRSRRWPSLAPLRERRVLAVAAMAVLVVAIGSAAILLRQSRELPVVAPPSPTPSLGATPSPSPTPTPTPTPTVSPSPSGSSSPSPSPSPATALVPGPLAAGTYTSNVITQPVTFTVPDGLILRYEKTENVWLATSYTLGAAEFNVLIGENEPGLLERLQADDRLTVSDVTETTVGGIAARSVSLSVAPDAYSLGPRNLYVSGAAFLTLLKEPGWYVYFLPGTRARVIQLPVHGSNVLVFYQAPDAEFDDFAPIAEAIVASLAFP
jgi:hypothetical protein